MCAFGHPFNVVVDLLGDEDVELPKLVMNRPHGNPLEVVAVVLVLENVSDLRFYSTRRAPLCATRSSW